MSKRISSFAVEKKHCALTWVRTFSFVMHLSKFARAIHICRGITHTLERLFKTVAVILSSFFPISPSASLAALRLSLSSHIQLWICFCHHCIRCCCSWNTRAVQDETFTVFQSSWKKMPEKKKSRRNGEGTYLWKSNFSVDDRQPARSVACMQGIDCAQCSSHPIFANMSHGICMTEPRSKEY